MKVLITGASGLLGRHLKIEADRPSHAELDISQTVTSKDYDLIINCAAYTDVANAEKEKEKCFDVNVWGVLNLIKAYPNTPFVQISTEYAKSSLNYYAITKRMAEDQLFYKHPCYLVIRTLFKETPWKYEKAFADQWTQGDQVEIIAPLIEKAIEDWDKKTSQLIYVGTGRKRIYDIAIKSKPDVILNFISEIKDVRIPADYE